MPPLHADRWCSRTYFSSFPPLHSPVLPAFSSPTTSARDESNNSNDRRESRDNSQEAVQGTPKNTATVANGSPDPVPDESRPATAGDSRRRPLTQSTSRGHDSHGLGGESQVRRSRTTLSAGPDATGAGHNGLGASGVLSSVEVPRLLTAPMHSDGKVIMRPLGRMVGGGTGRGTGGGGGQGGGQDPPSVVFEPGFSRLQTRRVILDR